MKKIIILLILSVSMASCWTQSGLVGPGNRTLGQVDPWSQPGRTVGFKAPKEIKQKTGTHRRNSPTANGTIGK